jgi:hypothetical protein
VFETFGERFSLAAANKNPNVIKTFLRWCVDQAVLLGTK